MSPPDVGLVIQVSSNVTSSMFISYPVVSSSSFPSLFSSSSPSLAQGDGCKWLPLSDLLDPGSDGQKPWAFPQPGGDRPGDVLQVTRAHLAEGASVGGTRGRAGGAGGADGGGRAGDVCVGRGVLAGTVAQDRQ